MEENISFRLLPYTIMYLEALPEPQIFGDTLRHCILLVVLRYNFPTNHVLPIPKRLPFFKQYIRSVTLLLWHQRPSTIFCWCTVWCGVCLRPTPFHWCIHLLFAGFREQIAVIHTPLLTSPGSQTFPWVKTSVIFYQVNYSRELCSIISWYTVKSLVLSNMSKAIKEVCSNGQDRVSNIPAYTP